MDKRKLEVPVMDDGAREVGIKVAAKDGAGVVQVVVMFGLGLGSGGTFLEFS